MSDTITATLGSYKPRFESGIQKIEEGRCPVKAVNPIACMFCPYGHMLECHWPMTCADAECGHYLAEAEE